MAKAVDRPWADRHEPRPSWHCGSDGPRVPAGLIARYSPAAAAELPATSPRPWRQSPPASTARGASARWARYRAWPSVERLQQPRAEIGARHQRRIVDLLIDGVRIADHIGCNDCRYSALLASQ